MTTTTENSAISLSTTGNPCCDLFFKSVRGADERMIFDLCDTAWVYNPMDVLRNMLYTRDCESGKGERQVFYNMMRWLWCTNEDYVVNMLHLLVKDDPHFGYWKDPLNVLLALKESVDIERHPVYNKVVELFADQLRKDLSSLEDGTVQTISMCAKYAPTKHGAHDKRLRISDAIAKRWFPEERFYQTRYRKTLRRMREHLRVAEALFCENRWDELVFDKMPGMCLYRHTEAFKRHCPSKWEAYLEDVRNRKKEMKVRMLYPYEIVMPYLENYVSICGNPIESESHIEAAWTKKVEEVCRLGKLRRRIIPICDVSGSMFCDNYLPIANSVSLGLLISEASEGMFKNTVITFSESPRLLDLSEGASLFDRLHILMEKGVGFNTDFVKVFKMLLHHMRTYNVKPEDAPEVLMCISDMQFDQTDSGGSNFKHVRNMYERAGYVLPEIWFWNVRGNTVDFPVSCHEKNVSLVSGFSPSVVDLLVEGDCVTPYTIMRRALDKERYKCVEENFGKIDLNTIDV